MNQQRYDWWLKINDAEHSIKVVFSIDEIADFAQNGPGGKFSKSTIRNAFARLAIESKFYAIDRSAMIGLIRKWQRSRLRNTPFPMEWERLLAARFPLYRRLPSTDLEILRTLIQIFLAEKTFVGCNGQRITDEIRVIIAAYACLLQLHRSPGDYPLLGTVVVYPTSFAAPLSEADQHGIVTETVEERLGESWELGSVALAWENVRALCDGRGGGLNVVLHEFAHQIDHAEKISEGAAPYRTVAGCRNWGDLGHLVYSREYSNRRRGRPLVLDPYGAGSVTEFFAVATEIFFERPVRLKAHHPDLYAALSALYRQDPAADWESS